MRPRLSSLIVSLSLPLLLAHGAACRGQEPDLGVLLKALDEQTEAIDGFSLHFESTFYLEVENPEALEADQLRLGKPEKGFICGEAVFDLVDGYYRMKTASVEKWYNGAAPYIATRAAYSYDGKHYRMWERERHGTKLPPRKVSEKDAYKRDLGPSVGYIEGKKEGPTRPEVMSWQTGADFFPSFGSILGKKVGMTRLADLLREAKKEEEVYGVEKWGDHLWRVTLADKILKGEVRLKIDTSYGGVVAAEWAAGDPPSVWERLFVERTASEEGRSLPKRLILVNTVGDGFVRVVKLSKIEINPDHARIFYQIPFPVGTRVHNAITDTTYVVGNLAERLKRAIQNSGGQPATRTKSVLAAGSAE